MSNQKSNVGAMLLRLMLTILLAFTLLGTVGSAVGVSVLQLPWLLEAQLEQQNAPQKAADALQTKWEAAYPTTAVPAEVYTDAISTDWLAAEMTRRLESVYSGDTESRPDFTQLEAAITAYFEQFATENNYEKDDTYTEKLNETIENAEKAVTDAIDVYQTATMEKAGILQKLAKLKSVLWIALLVCPILTVGGMLLLRSAYWIGTGSFAAGALLTIPTAIVLGSGIIKQFALKEAAVYGVFTGTMTMLTQIVLVTGIVLLAAGLVLVGWSMRRGKDST